MNSSAILLKPRRASRSPSLSPRRLLPTLSALFFLLACAGSRVSQGSLHESPNLVSQNAEAKARLAEARAALARGEEAQAEALFRALIVSYPSDPLREVAELELARLKLDTGKSSEAATLFESLGRSKHPEVRERAAFYWGLSLYRAGDYAGAAERLKVLRARRLKASEAVEVLLPLADAQCKTGERRECLHTLEQLAKRQDLGAAANLRVQERLQQLFEAEATTDEARAWYEELEASNPLWVYAARRALRDAQVLGDRERAAAIAARLQQEGKKETTGRHLSARGPTIGLILPSSGRGREVAQHVLEGATLALESKSPPGASTALVSLHLVVRDEQGDPALAEKAMQELTGNAEVVAVVGALSTSVASRMAEQAQKLALPTLLLNPSVSIAAKRPWAFRCFLSSEGETQELSEVARRKGASRFAFLGPEAPFSEAFRRSLEQNVKRKGGQWIGATTYPSSTTNFAFLASKFSAGGLDALLFSESWRRVVALAPLIRGAGQGKIPQSTMRFLLPSASYHPQLLAQAANHLQGALVSLPFDLANPNPETSFAARYRARFGREADTYALFAYDALMLLRQALSRAPAERKDLPERLIAEDLAAPTAGPSPHFASSGELRRATRIYEVRDKDLLLVQ